MRSKSKRTYKKKTKRKSKKRSNKRIKGGSTVADYLQSVISRYSQTATLTEQVASIHNENVAIKKRLDDIDKVNRKLTDLLKKYDVNIKDINEKINAIFPDDVSPDTPNEDTPPPPDMYT